MASDSMACRASSALARQAFPAPYHATIAVLACPASTGRRSGPLRGSCAKVGGRIVRGACARARGGGTARCRVVRHIARACPRAREAAVGQYARVRAHARRSFRTCTRACTPAREAGRRH
jgi:hypothetical protein